MNAPKPFCSVAHIARALVLAPLTAVSLLCGTARADSPAFANFAKVVVVTPSAAIVPTGDTTYADVPVLLRLSADISGFSYDDFQRADHGDLAVYDETMTSLPYEVQVWDKTGESLVWVKVPQFSANTSLLVAYGCADAAENDPSAVWGAYAIATHLDELGAAGTVADATGNGHDGTCWSGSTGLAGGVLGGYRDNRPAGASGQGGISFADTVSMNLGQHFTLETWVQLHALSTGWDHLFYKKESSGEWEGFATELYSEGGRFGQLSVNGRGGNETGCKINHGIAAADTWYHIQLVYSGTSVRLYNNGTLMGTGNLAAERHATWNRNVNVSLGIDSDLGSGSWNGAFDEFRVIGESFDDGRAAIEHAIQSDPAAFSYIAHENDGSQPIPGEPSISYANGVFSVTASLTAGAASSVKAVFDDGAEVELAPNGATAPWTATVPVSSALAADRTYTYVVRAQGTVASAVAQGAEVFHTGTVTVEAVADASEEHLVPGAFMFRRADTAHDLVVAYTVGGTATAGKDYTALSGTVTIPAGSATAQVAVQPLSSPFTDEDVTVVATVAAGPYTPSAAPATVTIANVRNAAFSTYARRLPLAVAEGKYSGGAVADVPVLVRLRETAGGFSYADFMRADYEDLAFVDETGAVLPYEVQTWDPAGESLVWVKVPTLGPATTIYALYGAAGSGRTAATDVWSGYTAVWHMDETEAGAVALTDATANGLDGTYGFQSSSAAGLFGTSRRMATGGGKPEDKGRALVPAPDAVFKGADNNQKDRQFLSASMWVKLEGSTSWAYLLTRKDNDDSDVWGFQIDDSNKNMRFWGDNGKDDRAGMSWGGGDFPSGWVKFDMVYDGGTYVFYVNGVETSRTTEKHWPNGKNRTTSIAVGGPVGSGTYGTFNGDMEEVRLIAGSVSSADRIKVQYLSESDADFFVQGDVASVDTTRPAVGYARVEEVDGVATVVIPLEAGGGNVNAVVRDASGTVTTNFVGSATAPATPSFAIASLPAANAWYDVASYAENGSQHDSRDYGVRVYTGSVSVEKLFDAYVDGLLPGVFRISAATGNGGLAEPLAVAYEVGGTAAAGTDFTALAGSATIPAGASFVDVAVTPLAGAAAGTVGLSLVAVQSPVAATARTAELSIRPAGVTPAEKRTLFTVQGYDGATVDGFPALIRLHEGDGSFSYANVRYRDTGADIHFTLADGTPLAHEIDTWNPDGESAVWVLLPQLKGGAAVLLCCGGAAQTAAPADVWTGMAGVWHMAPDESGYFPNRASASNQGRAWNGNSSDSDGIIGRARRISNADSRNQGDNSVTASNNDVFDVGSTLTFSAWLRYKQGQAPGWDRIVGRKDAYNGNDGWEISLSQDQPSGIDIRGGAQSSTSGNNFFATPVNDGEWHYVTVVYEDTGVTAYENGVLRHTGTIATGPIDNDRDLSFGNNSPRNEVTFKGTLDEIRLCSGALSAARIRADYLTVTSDLLKAQEGFATVLILQ